MLETRAETHASGTLRLLTLSATCMDEVDDERGLKVERPVKGADGTAAAGHLAWPARRAGVRAGGRWRQRAS
jgi:hypothetical protein